MAELIWSVLCYKGVVDKFTNLISLLEVTEKLTLSLSAEAAAAAANSEEPIYFVANLQLVSFWTRSQRDVGEEVATRVLVRLPGDSLIDPGTQIAADLREKRRARTLNVFQAFPFAGEGTYRVEMYSKEEEGWLLRATVPLEIALASPEKGAAPTELEPPQEAGARKTKTPRRKRTR